MLLPMTLNRRCWCQGWYYGIAQGVNSITSVAEESRFILVSSIFLRAWPSFNRKSCLVTTMSS